MKLFSNLSLIILSGGQGRRMGGINKGLMPYKNQLMIDHILDQLGSIFDDIVLVTNSSFDAFKQRCTKYPQLQIISDEFSGYQGPLAGIHSGLQYTKHQYSFIVPCDAPGPYQPIFEALYPHLYFQYDVIFPNDGQRDQPLFSLVHKNLITDLENALNTQQLAVTKFFNQTRHYKVNLNSIKSCFRNLNTPEDTIS